MTHGSKTNLLIQKVSCDRGSVFCQFYNTKYVKKWV